MMSDKSITVINVGGTYLEIPESLSAEDKSYRAYPVDTPSELEQLG
jgi:hypothetical protein